MAYVVVVEIVLSPSASAVGMFSEEGNGPHCELGDEAAAVYREDLRVHPDNVWALVYSYGLYNYGPYTNDPYSYGLHSYGPL